MCEPPGATRELRRRLERTTTLGFARRDTPPEPLHTSYGRQDDHGISLTSGAATFAPPHQPGQQLVPSVSVSNGPIRARLSRTRIIDFGSLVVLTGRHQQTTSRRQAATSLVSASCLTLALRAWGVPRTILQCRGRVRRLPLVVFARVPRPLRSSRAIRKRLLCFVCPYHIDSFVLRPWRYPIVVQ